MHRHDDCTTALLLTLQLTGTAGWRNDQGGSGALSRKDAALLALLALDGALPRDRLAALLWPQASTLKAYNSLRQRLFRLRRDTGHELAQLGDAVSLAPGVQTDLAGDASQAGELLGAFDYGDSQALDDWVRGAREHWRQRRADALTGVAARHEAAGAWAAAIACTQRLVAIAPLQEHAWRRLMRLHYLRGDRAAALAAFETFERQLRDELGARPSAETLEQLRLIEMPAAPAAAGPQRVLPASLLRPPRVVGRAAERRTLEAAWQAGQAVMLVGAAGMGKTRLLDDFLAGRDPIVREQGRPGDERSPYATASRWMTQVLALHPEACSIAQRGELARLLPVLGPAPRAPGHQGALWHAVEIVLEAAAARGLAAVVVDDLQFADHASVELLRWLLPSERLRGLRFALATRPAEDDARQRLLADWWADSRRPARIVLEPLDLAAVQELLHTLSLPGLPAGLAEDLLAHAGGKPFFVLETLKDLVLHGPPAQGLPRPASVRTLIDRRLQALPASAQGLLRVAAVAHQDLTAERAAQLLGTRTLELAEPWAALEAADVLHGTRFAHDLLRDAALARVPTPVRHSLHAALAQMLAQDPGVPPGRVAGHWLAAERWAEAGASLLAAGRAAWRTGRPQEQADLLQRAADCSARAGDAHTRFEALCARLDGLLVARGGQAVLDELPALQALPQTPRQAAELLQVACEALLNLDLHAAMLERSAALRRATEPFPDLDIGTLSLIGRACLVLGRHDEALPTLQQARSLAEQWARRQGDEAPLAHALGHLAHGHFVAGQIEQAMHVQQRAAEMALRVGDPSDHAIHTGNLATMTWLQGDAAAALGHARQARQSYQRLDALRGHVAAVNEVTLGMTAAHCGELGLGLQALQDAVSSLGSGAPATAVVKARVALAGLWLMLGQPQQALALYDALACRLDGLAAAWLGLWHLEHARALQQAGNDAAAVRHARALGHAQALQVADPGAAPSMLATWAAGLMPARACRVLQAGHDAAAAGGRHGVARSLQVLILHAQARRAMAPGRRAALARAAAQALAGLEQPHHTLLHPLHARRLLADVLARCGRPDEASACNEATHALVARLATTLPPPWRAGFVSHQGPHQGPHQEPQQPARRARTRPVTPR